MKKIFMILKMKWFIEWSCIKLKKDNGMKDKNTIEVFVDGHKKYMKSRNAIGNRRVIGGSMHWRRCISWIGISYFAFLCCCLYLKGYSGKNLNKSVEDVKFLCEKTYGNSRGFSCRCLTLALEF